jgi:hypothetical protein
VLLRSIDAASQLGREGRAGRSARRQAGRQAPISPPQSTLEQLFVPIRSSVTVPFWFAPKTDGAPLFTLLKPGSRIAPRPISFARRALCYAPLAIPRLLSIILKILYKVEREYY